VLANFLAQRGLLDELAGVPSYAFPESAALALAKGADLAEWRRRPEGKVPDLNDVDSGKARAIVDDALAKCPEGLWLEPASALDLVHHYGIPIATSRHATSAEEAARIATEIGFPVAVKAGSADLLHKTDRGGVQLGLTSANEVDAAYRHMHAALGEEMGGAIVQSQLGPGIETIVGVVQDASFGPLVMFGMGGIAVDLIGDRAFRVLPLTDVDATELIRSVKGSPLLFGYRNSPAADVASLEDLLLRIGKLVDDIPEVAEMDLNPVIVSPTDAVAVDVKIRLVPWHPHPELALRRLR
jgi:acyl-CoA synthetase (NDP forming)